MMVNKLLFRLLKHALLYSQPANLLLQTNPLSEPYFEFARNILGRTINILHYLYPELYTDADPFKIIYVSPDNIKYCSDINVFYGETLEGSWDQTQKQFSQNPVYISLKQRYKDGTDWQATPLYEEFMKKKTQHGKAWSRANFRERCNDIEQLYESIINHGYQEQSQLIKNKSLSKNNFDPSHHYLNEVTIDIGRDGRLLWNQRGQHRLSIAKILSIDYIPVLVRGRHKQWQIKRNNLNEDGIKTRTVHPDLDDI